MLLLHLLCIHHVTQAQNTDSLINLLPRLKGKEKAQALIDICYSLSFNDVNTALLYGNKALQMAYEINEPVFIASCQNDLALSYYLKGNYDSCIYLAEQAYKVRMANKLWRDAGASLSKVANGLYEQGKYDESLEKNLSALELFRKSNSKADAAKLLNNIGSIYERNNQLKEAGEMYKQSAETSLELKDYDGYVSAQCNYGVIFNKTGQPKEALKVYKEIIPICIKYSRKEFLSQIYQAMGVAERAMGNLQEGLNYYLKAKDIYEQLGSLNGMAIIYHNIGNCYGDLKRYDLALEYLNKALLYAREAKILLWQKLIYHSLYELYTQKEDYKKANEFLENYVAINDSIYNEETQNQLSKLQTQYNLKEKELTILNQENTIIQKQAALSQKNNYLLASILVTVVLLLSLLVFLYKRKAERRNAELSLQQSLQNERSRIARDLHDNLGAELTVISSLIDVKAYATENKAEKSELDQISDQVRKASSLMRDTIWTVSEEKISSQKFASKVHEFAERVLKPVNIQVNFSVGNSDFYLKPEATLQLFRITQEIINNAAKYSNAKLFIISCFKKSVFVLELSDNGKGMDLNKSTDGFGIQNIKARAKDIGAKLELESTHKKGTSYIIELSPNNIIMA